MLYYNYIYFMDVFNFWPHEILYPGAPMRKGVWVGLLTIATF